MSNLPGMPGRRPSVKCRVRTSFAMAYRSHATPPGLAGSHGAVLVTSDVTSGKA